MSYSIAHKSMTLVLAVCGLVLGAVCSMDIPDSSVNIDKVNFNEPSGICYHRARGTLFVVGDAGDVCEIKTDGTLIKQKHVQNGDYEGITHDPSTGLLYVAREGLERILEINPDNLSIVRQFSIPRVYKGDTIMVAGGQGIESITFVPDTSHAHGGTFFVANQSTTPMDPKDGTVIVEVEVALRATGTPKPKILKVIRKNIRDIAGMFHDSATGNLIFVSDVSNKVYTMKQDGTILSTCPLPGVSQEGITFDGKGYVYIAQDKGGVLKIPFGSPPDTTQDTTGQDTTGQDTTQDTTTAINRQSLGPKRVAAPFSIRVIRVSPNQIAFDVPGEGDGWIRVSDIRGRTRAILRLKGKAPTIWTPADSPAGVYVVSAAVRPEGSRLSRRFFLQ